MKAWRDQCLERLRAHVALALADDFRHLADDFRHLAERHERQFAELRAHLDRRLDELALVSESLVIETVRMQRQLAERLPSPDGLAVYAESSATEAENVPRAA